MKRYELVHSGNQCCLMVTDTILPKDQQPTTVFSPLFPTETDVLLHAAKVYPGVFVRMGDTQRIQNPVTKTTEYVEVFAQYRIVVRRMGTQQFSKFLTEDADFHLAQNMTSYEEAKTWAEKKRALTGLDYVAEVHYVERRAHVL
jgi:hypothetical protein